jgi:hypothetical protein
MTSTLPTGLPARFQWEISAPLVAPLDRPGDRCYSVKDPSVVHHDGRWHVFASIRSQVRTHQIEYISFSSWETISQARRELLRCREGYFCAPQVFYFRPHGRWYLVYQVIEQGRRLGLQPAFSTTETLADPDTWTPATLFLPDPTQDPAAVERWIDFWVICDDANAYLFFTSLDGRFWRMTTRLADFPHGFGGAQCVLQDAHDDWHLYEASHTYHLPGGGYLTVVEGRNTRRENKRFFLAYVADRLDGAWGPLAASPEHPFASEDNIRPATPDDAPWSDYVSHGELIRAGVDETLTVDPARLQVLIQGVDHARAHGKVYGEIPWRLGMLTYVAP